MTVEAPPAAPRTALTGQRVERVEDERLLTGAARFVADLELPGMREAAFVRSPAAHARIDAIDVAAAREIDGVVAVLTAADLGDVQPLADMLELEGAIKTPRPALPGVGASVRYVGEPVAVVVARDRYSAEDGAARVELALAPLPAVPDVEAALSGGTELFEHVPGNVYYRGRRDSEAAAAAFAGAAHVARCTLRINRQLACALEGRSTAARFDRGSGELTCWLSSQAPFQQRYLLSLALGLAESRVHVIVPDVGGAFGPKDFVFPEDVCVARAAMLLGHPVRWVEDRLEALVAGPQGKEQQIELEAAFDADGGIRAMRGRFVSDTGAFSYSAPGGLVDAMLAAQLMPGAYAVPAGEHEVLGVLTSKPPVAPYRGVGMSSVQSVRELLLDEVARDLGLDRIDIRRRNLIGEGPYTSCLGVDHDAGSHEACLERALELLDHAGAEERRAAALAAGRRLGIGVSPFVELTALGPRSGRQAGLDVPSHDVAWASVDLSGLVTVAVPTCSHGQGHATAFAQLAADALGVEVAGVRIVEHDTERAPWGMGTFASRSAVFGGGAVIRAAGELRERVLRVASLLLEAPVEALELDGGFAGIRGVPEARIPLAGIAGAAHFDPGVRAALGESGLWVRVFHDSAPATSNGCVAVEVEVDPDLCAVTLTRAVAVHDCGTPINPMIIEGQVRGGFAQGIGAALSEDVGFDADGRPLIAGWRDYPVPRSSELVPLRQDHFVTPSPNTIGGIKGMAEGSAIATPAAVVTAVADALAPLGFRVTRLPLTPQAIWEGLGRG